MKISIISAHFSPQLGYQENCIAKSLKRLGNEVSVITTTFISPRYRKILKPFKTGEYLHEGYRIIRLSTLLRFRQTVIPSGMKKVLYKIHPDVLICIGITKFMPLPAIYFARKNKTKVISIFGNLKKHYSLFFKKPPKLKLILIPPIWVAIFAIISPIIANLIGIYLFHSLLLAYLLNFLLISLAFALSLFREIKHEKI